MYVQPSFKKKITSLSNVRVNSCERERFYAKGFLYLLLYFRRGGARVTDINSDCFAGGNYGTTTV